MKWEYWKEIDASSAYLEYLGNEGWELIAVVPIVLFEEQQIHFYFKRQKRT